MCLLRKHLHFHEKQYIIYLLKLQLRHKANHFPRIGGFLCKKRSTDGESSQPSADSSPKGRAKWGSPFLYRFKILEPCTWLPLWGSWQKSLIFD